MLGSWRRLILAALLALAIFSAVLAIAFDNTHPVFAFLLEMVLGCFMSYGGTIFLLLPSMYLLSLWRPLSDPSVCALGLVLGAAMFVPVTLIEWQSSGPDSRTADGKSAGVHAALGRGPTTAAFPAAGLLTAAFYWWLATRRRAVRLPGAT